MKIGILTYHRSENYGALLQAFALQTYLRKLGYTVEFIDYWPTYHQDMYKLFSKDKFKQYSFLGKIKFVFIYILKLRRSNIRKKKTEQFIKSKFALSPSLDNENDWSRLNQRYDIVFYGSDQIWRKQNYIQFKDFNEYYFAKNRSITKKHVSYAASMGCIYNKKEDIQFLKNNLVNFDHISVREKNVQLFLQKMGLKAELVIDPVFLLSDKDWCSIVDSTYVPKNKKYILFYHLVYSQDAIKFVKQLSKEHACSVIEVRGAVYPCLYGKRYKQTLSPLQFLALIKHAKNVVSTSFHGVALSLIFKKQFFTTSPKDKSDRILSLLSELDLLNRFFTQEYDITNLSNQTINYNDVSLHLDKLISESKQYINNSINN